MSALLPVLSIACAHAPAQAPEEPAASVLAPVGPPDTPQETEAFVARVYDTAGSVEEARHQAQGRTLRLESDPEQPLFELALASSDAAIIFAVGNTVFPREPDAAFALHQRAYALDPGNPWIEFELAIDLHRLARYEEAAAFYERATQTAGESLAYANALLAHCLLELGRPRDAVERFQRAMPGENHHAIESVFASLYAPYDPWSVRARLAAAVEGGDAEAALELAMWDLTFRTDLWNVSSNAAALAVDLPRIRAGLQGHPDLSAMLEVVLQSESTGAGRGATEVAARFPERLPGPVPFATALLLERLASGSFDEASALDTYGSDLRARHAAGDPVGDRLLPSLLAMNAHNDDVLALDRTLCQRGSARSCAGVLAATNDPVEGRRIYDDAQTRFPNDPRFPTLALLNALDTAEPLPVALLVAYLRTRPRHMESSVGWRLAFAMLEGALVGADQNERARAYVASVLSAEIGAWNIECDAWSPPEARAAEICRTLARP